MSPQNKMKDGRAATSKRKEKGHVVAELETRMEVSDKADWG